MTKDEALKITIELMERFLEYDGISSSDYIDVLDACKEALERPTNMVAVPADQLEKMQQELKQLRDEHKKWQGFARRVS